jgi:hypothetical protein
MLLSIDAVSQLNQRQIAEGYSRIKIPQTFVADLRN